MTWHITQLRYESSDLIISLRYYGANLHVSVDNSKALVEEDFDTMEDASAYLENILGKGRWQDVQKNWVEITYRRVER